MRWLLAVVGLAMLSAAGCGRLFEGSPTQMHTSLQALVALPTATRLWFGHDRRNAGDFAAATSACMCACRVSLGTTRSMPAWALHDRECRR